MSRTITADAGVKAQPPPVGGLRVFGQQRLFSFDALTAAGPERRRALTIGRDEACDIWLPEPTVSGVHATITARAPVRGTWRALSGETGEHVFVLRDHGSKNGVRVSASGARGPFVPVREIRLELGMHVRIGAVTLVVVDGEGGCPIAAKNGRDFLVQARALYGSDQTAARFLGMTVARFRQLLARMSARGAKQ